MVIWKYPLAYQRDGGNLVVDLELPVSARPLAVGVQACTPVLWVQVDPDTPLRRRARFYCVMTGQLFAPYPTYVGTVLLDDGAFVLHVFGPQWL